MPESVSQSTIFQAGNGGELTRNSVDSIRRNVQVGRQIRQRTSPHVADGLERTTVARVDDLGKDLVTIGGDKEGDLDLLRNLRVTVDFDRQTLVVGGKGDLEDAGGNLRVLLAGDERVGLDDSLSRRRRQTDEAQSCREDGERL
jgi:hypothetical protein